MALPTYDKKQRRQNTTQLPKGAYVLTIKGAKEENNRNGNGSHLTIAFDIAEGDYAGIYQKQFDGNSNEDKKWPRDGMYYLNVPNNDSPAYAWTNWDSFFADLEDSNNGFVFSGNVSELKGKRIGGKFAIEQSEYNGNVYDHTVLRWTAVAADVRNGKAGRLPKDKLIQTAQAPAPRTDENGFMSIPDGAEEELPF